MIGNIWVRLNKMFEALRNSFNKLGFQTTDDIFTSIEEGKKQPTKEAVSDETKLSIKPRGDYEVVRKAQPRGRTTDQVSYELRRISDGRLIREFDKRKDAQQMLDVYTLPQEEVFAKYPELKPKYDLKEPDQFSKDAVEKNSAIGTFNNAWPLSLKTLRTSLIRTSGLAVLGATNFQTSASHVT
jgi:hypothetical protein